MTGGGPSSLAHFRDMSRMDDSGVGTIHSSGTDEPTKGCIMSRKKQRSESRLQLAIVEKYPEQVNEAKLRLCRNCVFNNSRQCQNLLPVTSDAGIVPTSAKARPLKAS